MNTRIRAHVRPIGNTRKFVVLVTTPSGGHVGEVTEHPSERLASAFEKMAPTALAPSSWPEDRGKA